MDKESLLYKSGDVFLPPSIINILYKSVYKTEHIDINYWSFMHVASGMFYRFHFNDKLDNFIMYHSLWEFWQVLIGMSNIKDYREWFDIFLDTLFGIIGFIIMDILLEIYDASN